jgi:hypothetical protein
MLVGHVLQLLKEYNTSNTNATLAAQGGKKASGKNYDNIITGKAKPYKGNEYETKYARVYPALADLVKKLKSNALKGDIMVTGPALTELQSLLQAYQPKQTPEGDYSLPFGDNVRMKYKSNNIFIGYHDPKASQPINNNIAAGPSDTAITK